MCRFLSRLFNLVTLSLARAAPRSRAIVCNVCGVVTANLKRIKIIHTFPSLSMARFSFVKFSEVTQRGNNEMFLKSNKSNVIRTRTLDF